MKDEPTSGLDATAATDILTALRRCGVPLIYKLRSVAVIKTCYCIVPIDLQMIYVLAHHIDMMKLRCKESSYWGAAAPQLMLSISGGCCDHTKSSARLVHQ